MAEQIKKIFLSNGTELDATAFLYLLLSSKDNIEISSPKNINIEPVKSIKFKPGSGAQVEFLADHTGDVSEVLLKALTAVDADGNDLPAELPIRFKFNCDETEFNKKGAAEVDTFDIKYKTGRKEGKGNTYCQAKMKARSWDIRCMEHGGIALQPNGEDGDGHENKIKFESNRISNIGDAAEYEGSGGDGMEFGTFNNEHSSLYTGDYRFKGDAPIYGVTRGELEKNLSTGKTDYPTQADDFKDIIPEGQLADPVTWNDIIELVRKQRNAPKVWRGTVSEYEALGEYDDNTEYHVIPD